MLWLLSSWHKAAKNLIAQIDLDLHVLLHENSINHFKPKLLELSQNKLSEVFTELLAAAHFKKLGFSIHLEPKIKSGRHSDFLMIKNSETIYVEATRLYDEDLDNEEQLNFLLYDRLSRLKYNFDVRIDLSPNFGQHHVAHLQRFLSSQLRGLSKSKNLPQSWIYRGNGNSLATITVRSTNAKPMFLIRPKAYKQEDPVGSASKKIKRKSSQLPKEYPGIILIVPSIKISAHDLREAVTDSNRSIFQKKMNTKISAVCIGDWVSRAYGAGSKIEAFLNRYANHLIEPSSVFDSKTFTEKIVP